MTHWLMGKSLLSYLIFSFFNDSRLLVPKYSEHFTGSAPPTLYSWSDSQIGCSAPLYSRSGSLIGSAYFSLYISFCFGFNKTLTNLTSLRQHHLQYTPNHQVKNGVKQGGSMSSTLFILAIGPLIRNLLKNETFKLIQSLTPRRILASKAWSLPLDWNPFSLCMQIWRGWKGLTVANTLA
jgi:hypothetical protein